MSKSSYFTVPGAQRKRKRDVAPADASKRGRAAAKPTNPTPRDDSISGSDSEDDDEDVNIGDAPDASSGEESSDNEGETEAERRLRLAERYLKNVQSEVQETIGFDAADLDRDLINERLIEDVAESKGRMYRAIAADYDFSAAETTQFRFENECRCITAIAACAPYAYTVSKDMIITKWELPTLQPNPPEPSAGNNKRRKPPPPARRRPKKLLRKKGDHRKRNEKYYKHHTAEILCVAASADGKFLVTGGADKKIIVWNPEDLSPLKVFAQHRGSVTSLAFRRGSNQLYSASADRTIKIWSLDQMSYVETLFGHQDEIVDVAALAQERCMSAGARDRTVRLWKVVEETQLVFRGGGSGGTEKSSSRDGNNNKNKKTDYSVEGSIDRIAMIDEETFVSGSDNGSLALWSVQKKKPLSVVPVAHGRDPPPKKEDADVDGRHVYAPPSPRWITALAVVPYSDLVLSGSWDGQVRAWRVSDDKRKLEPVGILGRDLGTRKDSNDDNNNNDDDDVMMEDGIVDETATTTTTTTPKKRKLIPCARGVVNDIDILEHGKDGKEGPLTVVVALGKEHRLGRWVNVKGRNGAMVFEIPRSA